MPENVLRVETYESMMNGQLRSSIERVHNYWSGKSLRDVVEEMPEPTVVSINEMHDVAVVQIEPNSIDYDQSRDILLALPYLNGYTPHHYIRAKTLQLLATPNHNMWLLPNRIGNKPAYSFDSDQRKLLSEGNMSPLGEVYYGAFDAINRDRTLGAVSVSGYSQGALTALAIAGVNQTSFSIERVNADEAPSQIDRDEKHLQRDFMKSSSLFNLMAAVKNADIKPLSQAMNIPRLVLDRARFSMNSQSSEAKMIHNAMTGSASELVRRAVESGAAVKLGYIAGSTLFDPSSVGYARNGLDIVEYQGAPFDRKHASGDNVVAHAIMALQGLSR